MKVEVKYIKSEQTLQRFGNMFLTEEAVTLVRS